MKTENWQQIETLFHTALDLDAKKRGEYLTRECADDGSLRREVESLLASFNTRDELFEQPVFETAIGLMGKTRETSLTGKTIGSYLIGEKLGSGGMGEVYLAEDTRLNRKVALKFLSQAFINDNWAKRQLMKEARATAMLDHPNICAVHGFEESGNFSFIVMQYVEGQTLAELIAKRNGIRKNVLPLGRQIVDALATAHAHGIIHRDIKPGNIMVTHTGQVKVLDFGLAKFIQNQPSANSDEAVSQVSQNGLIAGTVAYMSPEQLRGEKLDFRSDIFSLGILLFELVGGERPFTRKCDAETISAILNAPPLPLQSATDLPPGIEHLIQKCLQKDKEQRYQSVSEILMDLQNPVEIKRATKLFAFRKEAIIAFVFIFVLLIALGVSIYFQKTKVHNLAVLPIINQTSDPGLDYLSDGMTENLINRLGDAAKPYTIVSGYKGDNQDYLKIGRELNVDAVVIGKFIKKSDGQILLQNNLINVADNSKIWSQEVVFDTSDTLKIEERISRKVISSLNAEENKDLENSTSNRQTSDPEAFRLYMLGRHYWRNRNEENIKKAIEAFSSAIDIDPSYAKAHSGLANAYVVQSGPAYGSVSTEETMPKARASAKEAMTLDDNLAESHAAMAVVLGKYEYNWKEAEDKFKRAIELDPEYAQARYWYSELLSTTGRTDEAFREAVKAKDLDPFSAYMNRNVGRVLYYGHRYDEALKYFSQMVQKEPDNLKAKYMLGLVYLQKKMYPEAVLIFEQLYNGKERELAASALGYTYAKTNRESEARRILSEMNDNSKENPTPPQEKAIVLTGLGEKGEAIKWLEKSYEQHLSTLSSLKVEPLFDDLRSDPRFLDILRRMNLDY